MVKKYKICEICNVNTPTSAIYKLHYAGIIMLENVCLKCLFKHSLTLNCENNIKKK